MACPADANPSLPWFACVRILVLCRPARPGHPAMPVSRSKAFDKRDRTHNKICIIPVICVKFNADQDSKDLYYECVVDAGAGKIRRTGSERRALLDCERSHPRRTSPPESRPTGVFAEGAQNDRGTRGAPD